jgi:hypothetical protein
MLAEKKVVQMVGTWADALADWMAATTADSMAVQLV